MECEGSVVVCLFDCCRVIVKVDDEKPPKVLTKDELPCSYRIFYGASKGGKAIEDPNSYPYSSVTTGRFLDQLKRDPHNGLIEEIIIYVKTKARALEGGDSAVKWILSEKWVK